MGVRALLGPPEEQAELHHRSQVDRLELEAGHHPEVASATAEGPEQVRVLALAGVQQLTVGGHDVGTDEAVDGQATPSRQPAHPAAQRQSAHAGVTDDPRGHRQPVLLRGPVQVAKQGATLHPHPSGLRVDVHAIHPAEVDHQPALGHRVARKAVPAASDGDLQLVVASVSDGGGHVLRAGALDDRGRSLVDIGVPELACLVVSLIDRGDHRSTDPPLQRLRHRTSHDDHPVDLVSSPLPQLGSCSRRTLPRRPDSPASELCPGSARATPRAAATKTSGWSSLTEGADTARRSASDRNPDAT